MEPYCYWCDKVIELDSGEPTIGPGQPTKMSSCPSYCPNCGEADLVMELKCRYCGEIDMTLRTAEDAKPIAEEAARRSVTVAAPAPTSTGKPTKGASCLRYCPYCGEAVLAMEPKCCYCGEIIDLPLRLAEEAKRIAEEAKRIAEEAKQRLEEAARRPVIVPTPASTPTSQPTDSSGVVVLLFMVLLFMAGYGWTAWKIHVLLG